MVAIAMTREMGTLGKDVAQGIAKLLGLKVIHSELVEHDIAKRLGVQDSAVHRYLEGDASVFERWRIDKEKLSRFTVQEISELPDTAMSSSGAGVRWRSCEQCRTCCACACVPRCRFVSGS